MPTPTPADYSQPDTDGYFGAFGGSYVAETLVAALTALREEYARIRNNDDFQKQFRQTLAEYVGRPSPVYFAKRLTAAYGGI